MNTLYLIKLKGNTPGKFYHIPGKSASCAFSNVIDKAKIACFYKKIDAYRSMIVLEKFKTKYGRYPNIEHLDYQDFKSVYVEKAELELFECNADYLEYLFITNNVNSKLCTLDMSRISCVDMPFMEFDMSFYSENLENYID